MPLVNEPRAFPEEPIAEKVRIASALLVSSLIYAGSIILSTVQFFILNLVSSPPAEAVSSIAIVSALFSAVAAFYLAGGIYSTAGTMRKLHYPALLIFVLGIANVLLSIALVLIFPSYSTINSIITQLETSGGVAQIVGEYYSFFLLIALAGMLGIVGMVGFLVAINRVFRVLGERIIQYGLAATIIFAVMEAMAGLPLLMIIPPILFVIGAKRSILT